jgi:hypothetical protein
MSKNNNRKQITGNKPTTNHGHFVAFCMCYYFEFVFFDSVNKKVAFAI